MRTAVGEQADCDVQIDVLQIGQCEGCDRVEAGFFEGVESPVEHALVLARARTLNELLFHTLSFGSKEAALNGRRRQMRHSNEG